MSTYRRKVDRDPIIEVSSGKEEEEVDIDTLGPMYNDTQCVIDKDTSFQWGEIYKYVHQPNLPPASKE
jgi:hypothetical protein